MVMLTRKYKLYLFILDMLTCLYVVDYSYGSSSQAICTIDRFVFYENVRTFRFRSPVATIVNIVIAHNSIACMYIYFKDFVIQI